jgi:ATP-binding cassette, subfamily C (CFTR/MRP), member 1
VCPHYLVLYCYRDVVPHFLTERTTQVVLGFILSISLVNLGIAITCPRGIYFFPSLVLEAVAFLVLPLLTYLSHTRTRRSSTITLLFWLAYFPALLIWTRTTLLEHARNPTVFALRWGIGGLGVVAFALECLGPEFRAEPNDKPRSNPESPLLTANVFSVWTFGWLSSLMKKGAGQFITEDDLPELLPEDEAANVGQTLQRNLKKQ